MNGTYLQNAEFNRFDSWECGGYCGSADLTNADLYDADLTDANLFGADLTECGPQKCRLDQC